MALLSGKTALITGGTKGIGRATAQRFAEEGATVFITGRDREILDQAVAELGTSAIGVQCEVTDGEDLDRLYATITGAGRGLDVVFANAGVAGLAPLEAITEQHFDELFSVNVKGLLWTVQKALPLLNEGASIVLCSSTLSELGRKGNTVYAATKAAVRSFARTWADELSDRKIRVNAVLPTATETPMVSELASMSGMTVEEFRAWRTLTIPMGRLATPLEVADSVLFLASDLSSFTTGIALAVDGGGNQV
jgi:NAD(P)-dependent dehydrogenase (short-subunit alcohol dehydrogenase family)